MAVFRVEKNRGYTVMSNHHLRNKALSLKAKGLLSQMLSLPEDWDYTLKGLSLINRESIDAIRTAVWELEKAGYIRREQGRDPKGKMADMVYTIYEQPVLENPVLENPTSADPVLENPTSDNPASENPTQLNKEVQRTNLPRKEKLNTDGQSTDSIPIPSLTPAPLEDEAAATPPERKGTGKDEAVRIYREIILENIEYGYLIQDKNIDREQLDEIVDLMLETICTSRKTIRVAGDDYPVELVKSKYMKLNGEHIRFVLDGLRDGSINGGFQLRFPARPFPLGVPLGVALALALAWLHHGQSVFLTKPVTGAPDVGIALFIGNVLALIHHIHGTKNNVIMNVSFVYVGCQHIGIFSLQHFVGKLPPDLMGLFRRGLAGGKGLYQVMGQIVALLDGLGQQHFKFNVRRFVGAGKGGHQQLVVGLVRVFDVVQGFFQR